MEWHLFGIANFRQALLFHPGKNWSFPLNDLCQFRHNFDDDGTSARNLSDTMCRAAKGNSNFCLDEIAYKNFKKI